MNQDNTSFRALISALEFIATHDQHRFVARCEYNKIWLSWNEMNLQFELPEFYSLAAFLEFASPEFMDDAVIHEHMRLGYENDNSIGLWIDCCGLRFLDLEFTEFLIMVLIARTELRKQNLPVTRAFA